jgi:hypothetical protein
MRKIRRLLPVLMLSASLYSLPALAGPPYNTDDPEPTPFKHWEYYISTINNAQGSLYSGTLPHLEFNYGIIPNMQIHLLLPLNYSYGNHLPFHYGYGDTELGFKYRFVKESDKIPEIGTFPIFLVPTVKNSEFAGEKTQVFIPIWLQKSWGKLTSFGGGGYWINPGTGNKNWVFTGLTLQYDFTDKISLGEELYYQSADTEYGKSSFAFNVGGMVNFSEKFHFIFSLGHSIVNENFFTSYMGLWWTI